MFGSVTADTELAQLEGTVAEARARVRVGAMILVTSLTAFALSWVYLGKAIMMMVVLAFAGGGTIGGSALMLDGAVRGAMGRRQVRARKQLPTARILEASRRKGP